MSQLTPTSSTIHATPAEPATGLAWWENALLQGLVFSLFLHMTLGVVAAWVSLRVPEPTGIGDSPVVELASMEGSSLSDLPSVPMTGSELTVASISQEQEFRITDLSSPFTVSGDAGTGAGLEALGGAGSGHGAGDGSGDGLGGAGGEARFFGVEARGSRFAFVVDVSGSMMDESKIGALRAALIESIEGMLDSASFCVILYSSTAMPLMGDRWCRATEENKQAARRNVLQVVPSGSTNPLPAFVGVFELKPRPDVIYFMTDGVFPPEVEGELPTFIEQQNRGDDIRVAVHCITFADRGAEKLMRRIARQSGGSYTHVEAPRR